MSRSTWCQKSVFLAVCVGVCRLLSAGVIYVAPELPEGSDGSGSSWANAMTSVADALLAASQMQGGGEVWVRKGYYLYNSTATGLPIYSNVKVIGGFAGDETSADAADTDANPTVIGCLTHSNGTSTYTPKWQVNPISGGTYVAKDDREILDRTTWQINYPPEAWRGTYDRTAYYVAPTTAGAPYGFTDSAGNVTGAVIKGLVIYGFYTTAISVAAGSSVEIVDCRIVACGGYNASAGGVASKGGVHVRDTLFLGCATPIGNDNSPTALESVYENCRILYCNSGKDLDVIYWMRGNGKIENCVIRNNWVKGNSSYFARLMNGTCEMLDTLVEDNVIANAKGQGIYATGWDFLRCIFRGNELKQPDCSATLHVACLSIYGKKLVRDTLFENNKVSGSRANESKHYWSPTVASCTGGGALTCFNCTFINNTNAVPNSAYDSSGTIVSAVNGANYGVSMVNCVFANNRSEVEINAYGSDAANDKDTTVAALNSVFYSDDESYVPFRLSSLVSPGLANCCISRWSAIASTIPTGNNGYLYNITDQDPKLDRSVKTGENGVVALGVGPESPYRKTGRGIWKSSDNRYWFYDDNPDLGHTWRWRNVADKRILESTGAYMTSSPPPGINADFSSPLAPDAFGAARKLGKVAYGPINAAPHGMIILFR